MTENDKIKAIIADINKYLEYATEFYNETFESKYDGAKIAYKQCIGICKKYLPEKLFIPCENCKKDLPPMVLRADDKNFCSQDCLEKYLEE